MSELGLASYIWTPNPHPLAIILADRISLGNYSKLSVVNGIYYNPRLFLGSLGFAPTQNLGSGVTIFRSSYSHGNVGWLKAVHMMSRFLGMIKLLTYHRNELGVTLSILQVHFVGALT